MKIFGNFVLATVMAGYSMPFFKRGYSMPFFKRGYSMPMVKRATLTRDELQQLNLPQEEEDQQQKRGYSMPFFKRGYSMPLFKRAPSLGMYDDNE